jgi:hypothetical protein
MRPRRTIDWFGIESNLSCYPGIRGEVERRGMRVELRAASASGLDAEDASMGAVVSTFALSTVPRDKFVNMIPISPTRHWPSPMRHSLLGQFRLSRQC